MLKSNSLESLSEADLKLLSRMHEANSVIELDSKSLSSLSKASSTSSINSADQGRDEENEWYHWGRLISTWDEQWKENSHQMCLFIRRGVPHYFRPIVWQLLSKTDKTPEMYNEYSKDISPFAEVIQRDVGRTYPDHPLFKEKDGHGQRALLRILKAYSLQDPDVGYCQGMGFVAGILLMQMPEEEAFQVFSAIMLRIRDCYKPGMGMLGVCLTQLETMVKDAMPDLYEHFQLLGIPTSLYASKWFLTLFTAVLSTNISCRIIDVFLIDGIEIIFKVAMALLNIAKVDLMSMDIEATQKYFINELPKKGNSDPEQLLKEAFKVNVSKKVMKKVEAQHTVKSDKSGGVTLKLWKLRSENSHLKRVIIDLKRESTNMSEKLSRALEEASMSNSHQICRLQKWKCKALLKIPNEILEAIESDDEHNATLVG